MTPHLKALSTCLVGLVSTLAPLLATEDLVWPRGPGQPVVRWESTVRSLAGFEVAVYGPSAGPARATQKLKRPSGLAFDARGRLLISDSRQGLLLQLDADLGVVLILGSGTEPSLVEPRGVAVHPDGTIFVADSGLHQVVAFDSKGAIKATYGAGALDEPVDVAISPNGERLYVADSQTDRIAVFDLAGGAERGSFGQRGKGAGEFYLPTALEFDDAGNLMVVDQLNSRVQLFDANGTFTRALTADRATGFSRPRDVAIDDAGRIYLTDSAQSRIQVYDRQLEPLLFLGRNGMGNGEFLGVGAIAVSGERLAVLDRAGGRLQLFHLFGVEPRAVAPRVAQPVAARTPAAEKSREMTPPAPAQPRSTPPEPGPPVAETAAMEAAAERQPVVEEAPAAPESTVAEEEARIAQELVDLITGWAQAWSARDPDRYLDFYAESFEPAGGLTREAWAARRRDRIAAPSSIEVGIEIVETRFDQGSAEVTFLQSYSSDRFSDRVRKALRFVRQGDAWKIDRETVLEEL